MEILLWCDSDESQAVGSLAYAEEYRQSAQKGALSVLVAGPGIEPGSGGYEPPEVPLLYPAIFQRARTIQQAFKYCNDFYHSLLS